MSSLLAFLGHPKTLLHSLICNYIKCMSVYVCLRMCVTNRSGCSVGGTRLVTRVTFVLGNVLTSCLDPVLTGDTTIQSCWHVKVRSYAILTQMQWSIPTSEERTILRCPAPAAHTSTSGRSCLYCVICLWMAD